MVGICPKGSAKNSPSAMPIALAHTKPAIEAKDRDMPRHYILVVSRCLPRHGYAAQVQAMGY